MFLFLLTIQYITTWIEARQSLVTHLYHDMDFVIGAILVYDTDFLHNKERSLISNKGWAIH